MNCAVKKNRRLRIYVASSWRCERHGEVVDVLREEGHDVYDYRNPPGNTGFEWSEAAPWWTDLTPDETRCLLSHPKAQAAFREDMDALKNCDVCILVLPSGRSAHLELGFAAGAGKKTAVLLDLSSDPELMLLAAERICTDLHELCVQCEAWSLELKLSESWGGLPWGLQRRLVSTSTVALLAKDIPDHAVKAFAELVLDQLALLHRELYRDQLNLQMISVLVGCVARGEEYLSKEIERSSKEVC